VRKNETCPLFQGKQISQNNRQRNVGSDYRDAKTAMKIKNYDSTDFSRRDFISRTLGGGVACAVAGAIILPLSSVSKPVLGQPTFSVTPLKNNLSIISSSGGNVLVAAHMEQTCVVDGGKKSEAEALLEVIQGIADGPISTLFNSNWRPHHCGLNHLLGPEGASIIAHENTRLWQNNDFVVDWEERHYTPIPKPLRPTRLFTRGDPWTWEAKRWNTGASASFILMVICTCIFVSPTFFM